MVTLLPGTGYTLGENTVGTVQIDDDDTAPGVVLSVDPAEVSEGAGATEGDGRGRRCRTARGLRSDLVVPVTVSGSGVAGACRIRRRWTTST